MQHAKSNTSINNISKTQFHDHQTVLKRKWANLAKNDPRRVVRALAVTTPRGETLEGDNYDEIPSIFEELKQLSSQATSETWKGLVDAGIITAL